MDRTLARPSTGRTSTVLRCVSGSPSGTLTQPVALRRSTMSVADRSPHSPPPRHCLPTREHKRDVPPCPPNASVSPWDQARERLAERHELSRHQSWRCARGVRHWTTRDMVQNEARPRWRTTKRSIDRAQRQPIGGTARTIAERCVQCAGS